MERGSEEKVPESPHFRYEGGRLRCDGVDLGELAEAHGTPLYVYSAAAIDAAYEAIREGVEPLRSASGEPCLIAYAIKANSNMAILRRLATRGCGADIVSGGELRRCLRAGIPAERIVYSGVGKSDQELELAVRSGIRAVHVESAPEVEALEAIAARLGVVAPMTLRVNPDVDPETHPYIATGLHDTKFGLSLDSARALLPRVLGSAHLRLEGVACHIGSQLMRAEPLRDAVEITARFAVECVEAGAELRTLDAGGGFPILYGDESERPVSAREFGLAIREGLERGGADELGLSLIVEPGRALVGDAGALLTRVIFEKEQYGKRFLIVDAAMTELIRPALYDAYHAALPVRAPEEPEEAWGRADLVGPVCETGDFFAINRKMPKILRHELVLLRGAGAYGTTMASTYNSRPLAAEVLIEGGVARLIRRRQSFEEMIALEDG